MAKKAKTSVDTMKVFKDAYIEGLARNAADDVIQGRRDAIPNETLNNPEAMGVAANIVRGRQRRPADQPKIRVQRPPSVDNRPEYQKINPYDMPSDNENRKPKPLSFHHERGD